MNEGKGNFITTMSPTNARGISLMQTDPRVERGTSSGWCSDCNRHKNVDKRQYVRQNEQVDRILSGA